LLVYGFVRAAASGWGDHLALGAFGAAVVLLAAFLGIESRARQPITPLRLFADVSRSGSFVARLLLIAGMFGVFYFLTQFLQQVMGFSPLRAGVAFLPLTVALFGMSRTAPRLMPRLGAKPLMIAGMLTAIASLAWLSQVSPATGYWSGVFGPMVLLGIGMGLVFVPLTTASLAGVAPADSGAASSMVNVMQQVGGSLGLAAGRCLRHREPDRAAAPAARSDRGRPGAAGARPRHGHGLRRGGDPQRGQPAGDPRADPDQEARGAAPAAPCG
jgi:predicted MFS family arabinose efflux permease